MVLRSDELANEAEVERDQRFRGNIRKGVGAAASLGAIGLSEPIASRIMPFLNQYIPAGLAMKGISKISPKLGAFLQKGQEKGLDIEEGLNFVKDKISSGKEQKTPGPAESKMHQKDKTKATKSTSKDNRNIIEQYSPELHQFITGHIQNGRSPLEAGALAQMDEKFKSPISKITKDHKTDWSAILQAVYGALGGQQVQGQPQQQAQPQQPQQASPQGQGSQGLANIMNEINQFLGQK